MMTGGTPMTTPPKPQPPRHHAFAGAGMAAAPMPTMAAATSARVARERNERMLKNSECNGCVAL